MIGVRSDGEGQCGDIHDPASELSEWVAAQLGSAGRFLFGVCGPPGSGKSTLAGRLAAGLGAPVVSMDGFHRSNEELDALGLRDVKGAPATFDAAGFVALVEQLRTADDDVLAPVFDRSIDAVRPAALRVGRDERSVIIEGNYLLLDIEPWARLTRLLDAICYLDVPRDELRRRLIDRHVRHGRSLEEATEFVERSDLANAMLVEHSRARADIVIDH